MEQALLSCTPLPLDIIRCLIIPRVDELNHREKFASTLEKIRKCREKKGPFNVPGVYVTVLRDKQCHLLHPMPWGLFEGTLPWWVMSYAEYSEKLHETLYPYGRNHAQRRRYTRELIRGLRQYAAQN